MTVSERQGRRTSVSLHVIIALLMALVVAFDLLLPLGLVVWVFYLAPLVLTVLGWRRWLPVAVAALSSFAILVGIFVNSAGVLTQWVVLTNRAFGLVTLWTVAGVAQQLIATRVRAARENWIQKTQSRLIAQLQGELSARELGDNVLERLAVDVGAQVGALYVSDVEGLSRAAGYALPADDMVPLRVQLGQGLVGQAAKEGRSFELGAVPAPDLRINSALADLPASHILVTSAKIHDDVYGVLELGKREPFDEAEQALIQRLSEPLAVALRSAAYRQRLKELLSQTQHQAEELQAQAEELRVANEELEEQSRTLKEIQARLELQQAELEESNAQLEEHTQALESQKAELIVAQGAISEKASELARANQMKSEFLANMSHELRTPLNSSLILAKLLSDNPQGNLSDDQVRYADTIYSAGNDLLALINDILDLSKIEAGRFEVHPETVNVAGLMTLLERTFEPTAIGKGLSLRTEVAPDVPRTIDSDGNRLQQILRNLMSNAVKFTEQGEVVLSVRAPGANQVAFEVRDTGIGIPNDKQQIIFEPFTQADGTTSRKYGGTGLGLSISRQLARLLGGELLVESRPEEGSTFILRVPTTIGASTRTLAPELPSMAEVEVPASQPAMPASLAVAEERSHGSSGKPAASSVAAFQDDRDSRSRGSRLVLVVEDDVAFARILFDLAHESDFDCVVATTAGEGIELASKMQPVGVLLDVRLPDASGLSVLEELKRNQETRHIPVHVLSAHDYAEPALHLGALGYTLKPVQREEIEHALRRIEGRLAHDMRRILVVEDSAELRENLRQLLKDDTVEVETVGTVKDALKRLESRTFDCMVLDLMLPDASGFELLERMSEGTRYSFPPVIVYTGRSLSRDEELKLRRYSSSIIVKGARSPERLLDEVSLFLHRVESKLPAEQKRLLEAARAREQDFEGRKILVVEDDVRNVYALTSVFEPRGAEVRIARNGREALDHLEGDPNIDLVLMDTMMPVMDGLEATREIRKDPKFRSLPIISVTAKAMRDDQELCMQAGASDYLSKPLEVDRLLSLCRVWLPR